MTTPDPDDLAVALMVLQDPDCPVETWLALYPKLPWVGLRSALYPLVALAHPEQVREIEAKALDWTRHLTEPERISFACDCAEQALTMYETTHGPQEQLRDALQVARSGDQETINEAHLALEMRTATSKATDMVTYIVAAVWYAVRTALMPSAIVEVDRTLRWCRYIVPGADWDVVEEWQRRRLLAYLAGNP